MRKVIRYLAKRFVRISLGLALTAITVANVVGYLPSEVVGRLDNLIYDVRLRASVKKPQLDDRIVIVDIDEKSLREVGRWPWSREKVAELVKVLVDKLGAAVVSFDVVFAEPEDSDALQAYQMIVKSHPGLQPALKGMESELQTRFDRDALFAQTIADRPVVLGWYLNRNPEAVSGALPPVVFKQSQLGSLTLDATQWQGYGGNLPILQSAAEGGFFNPIVDSDGTIRAIPVLAEYQGGYYQSLALATLRRALGDPQVIPVFPNGVPDNYGALEALSLRSKDVQLNIPVERGLITLVNFRARGGPGSGGYRYISASDVLAGKVKQSDIDGRIVLVGTTAPGLLDLRSTPVNPAYPGVEVHANVLSSMLDGNYKIRPEYSAGLLLIIVLAVGVTLSVLMPLLSATYSLLTALVILLASVGINSWLYFSANLVLPVAPVLLLVLAIFMVDTAYGYLAESRSKRQMVNLFGEYVAPELVTEMAANPQGYSMEGDSKELTVMFSDVRGFTTISESLTPNELREYINEYLTVMSEIIRSHRGTLDKYIGDAIMAFWGAPVPDKDHATLATQAAMAMQEEAIRLNERFKTRNWPALAIGVGVNTGTMRVGDMGSKIRRAYTVMGDAVNLGSRLEGITKTYGVGVIVGEKTREACRTLIFQELDAVRVKGKHEPVSIFRPWGTEEEAGAARIALIEQWHDVLAHFKAQRWDAALKGLEELERTDGEQVLYTLYKKRIAVFMESPPPLDWDGVTQFETK
ncbi:MAG TPA: adenylate/guanylate cyclase domain-containing protein [Limnobacter sp.]|uniref:CHASE2 domain-containing protein n=1 Tax=Limnobacter sp. TaxID=2003368 RepID=UPI002E366436|nr:adenylate/guanylate cyclase domain-containing protein [Limnobacter sp.]HEX5485345.1 adenylate/guanylate cyclase domain-containing protein [Limnobacter sp.]